MTGSVLYVHTVVQLGAHTFGGLELYLYLQEVHQWGKGVIWSTLHAQRTVRFAAYCTVPEKKRDSPRILRKGCCMPLAVRTVCKA